MSTYALTRLLPEAIPCGQVPGKGLSVLPWRRTITPEGRHPGASGEAWPLAGGACVRTGMRTGRGQEKLGAEDACAWWLWWMDGMVLARRAQRRGLHTLIRRSRFKDVHVGRPLSAAWEQMFLWLSFRGWRRQHMLMEARNAVGACRCKLILHVSSLVCALGMIAVYVASFAMLRGARELTTAGAEDAPGGGSSGASHVDGSLDGATGGRADATETAIISFSILLTLGSFAAKMIGVRQLLRAARAGTAAVVKRLSVRQQWSEDAASGFGVSRAVPAALRGHGGGGGDEPQDAVEVRTLEACTAPPGHW